MYCTCTFFLFPLLDIIEEKKEKKKRKKYLVTKKEINKSKFEFDSFQAPFHTWKQFSNSMTFPGFPDCRHPVLGHLFSATKNIVNVLLENHSTVRFYLKLSTMFSNNLIISPRLED